MSASRDYAQRFTFADCFKNIFLVRSLLTSSPCNFKLNPNQNSPSFHNRRTLLFATNPPPLRHRDDEKSRHRRPQPTLRLPRDDKKSRHRRPPPAATSPPPLSHTGGDFILELKSYNNTEIKTKTMNRSKDNSSKLSSVFYAQNYHPIQAGSIDGTDVLPHDNAVYRALLCSSAGLYDPLGDPNVIGEDPYCTLFVGRLSHLITEDTLRQAMSKYGTVKNLRLVRHIVTGASRGYAFVEYESERDMHRAYEKAHHSIIDDSEIIVDYNRQQLMAGWIPRRLGGGLGGKKESGQLRFGGRERPFRAPLRPIPLDDLKRLGIPPPPEGNYMSRFEIPSPPRRKRSHAHREDKHSRSRRRSSSRDHAYDERRYAEAEGGSWTSHRDDRSYYYDDEHERRSCSHDREDYSRKSRDSQSHRHDRTSTSHDHRRSDTKRSSDREQYDHGRSDMRRSRDREQHDHDHSDTRRSSDREQCDHGRSDARRSGDREQHDHDRSDTRRSSDREQRDHSRSERRRSSDREQRDHGRSDTKRSSDRGQRSHKRHRHE